MANSESVGVVVLGNASPPTVLSARKHPGFPMKLHASLPKGTCVVPPFGRIAIPTGITVVLPDLIEAHVVAPRSWDEMQPLSILNSPGTIDPDYRGEIHAILINLSQGDVSIEHGQEIAELRLARFVRVQISSIEEFQPTERGMNGLGSTGTN